MKTREKRLLGAVALIGIVAVNGSLLWIAHRPEPRVPFGDELTYLGNAHHIVNGDEWSPNPLWPSLYSRFLAVVLAAGGGSFAVEMIQSLMLVGVALLLADLTRHLSGSPLAGAVAGWMALSYPPFVAFAHYMWPEIIHLLLFLGALWILVRRSDRYAWLIAAGLLLGLAIVTKNLLRPFLPVLLVPLVLAGPLRQRVLRLALVAAGTALAPALLLDEAPSVQGWIATPAFNVWVGLNDRSRKNFVDEVVFHEYLEYQASADSLAWRNRILQEKTLDLVRRRGMLPLMRDQLGRQYFRLFDKDSFLSEQLPGGAVAAYGGGYVEPQPLIAAGLRGYSYFSYTLILVGAIVGIAVCRFRGHPWLWVVASFLAYNIAIFFLLHIKSRYRIQMLPFLFLFSGCAVSWVAQRLWLDPCAARLWRESIPLRRGWIAAAAGALILFFAWGRPLLEP